MFLLTIKRLLFIALIFLVYVLNNYNYNVDAAKILAVFPTPSYSHHIVFKVYIQALAERGHDIIVIKSTDRVDYTENTHRFSGNITEIDASFSQQYYTTLIKQASVFRKRGVVADSNTVTAHNYIGVVRMISEQFQLPVVKSFIDANKHQKFDVLITEAFMDYPLVFSHLFGDIPIIQISSGYALAENFETMGAVSRHPVYYPNLWRDKFNDLTIWEMIHEIYVEFKLYNEFAVLADEQTKMLRQQFGPRTPCVNELRNRVQLLFVNTHAIFDNNRPVPPSVQYLGGLHLHGIHQKYDNDEDAHTLFGLVKEFLDNSTEGAVYVSFGSSINTENIDDEFIDMLIDTFKRLPYNVLWKYDGYLSNNELPANVFAQKWFDQYQLLHHRNLKVFVTQGGVQSTDEAIDAKVPLVGVPMMGDQVFNTNKYAELKIGRVVDTATVTSRQLVDAIKDVAKNPVYLKNIISLRHKINHQLVSPLHKAIWYTEHVINTRGHETYALKPKSANVNYSDYIMSYIIVPFVVFTVMNHLRQLLQINLL